MKSDCVCVCVRLFSILKANEIAIQPPARIQCADNI